MNSFIQRIKNHKYVNIGKDFFWSIFASVIATGALQLAVYPLLASYFDKEIYGVLLTSMGLVNTIGLSLGNGLNNTRLIREEIYLKKQISGDFNFILVIANVFGFVIMFIVGYFWLNFESTILLLLLLLVVLLIMKSYLLIYFRLKLNFKQYFINSILISIGYILGSILIPYIKFWPIIFIIGETFSILHILFFRKWKVESFERTTILKGTLNVYTMILFTNLISNVLMYLDRLIIYPVLGPEFVSIYAVASFFGKSLGIIAGPISGVLLSYFASKDFIMNIKKYNKISSLMLFMILLFLPFLFFLAPFVTSLLYPSIYEDAFIYIFGANIGALISVLSRMLQPAVLKYAPTYWQIIKEVIFGIVYIVFSIILMQKYQLYGIIYSTIISNVFKCILLYLLGYIYIMKTKKTV